MFEARDLRSPTWQSRRRRESNSTRFASPGIVAAARETRNCWRWPRTRRAAPESALTHCARPRRGGLNRLRRRLCRRPPEPPQIRRPRDIATPLRTALAPDQRSAPRQAVTLKVRPSRYPASASLRAPYPPHRSPPIRARDSRGPLGSRAPCSLWKHTSCHPGLDSSPCMTGYSPSSSDFEPISDSEVVQLAPSPLPPPAQTLPSNLSRTLSQRRRGREESYLSTDSTDYGRSSSQAQQTVLGPEAVAAASLMTDDERHRRGTEGDDEDSSAFEDVEDARGRARTRRVRDPELKKSMLEDALRSRSVLDGVERRPRTGWSRSLILQPNIAQSRHAAVARAGASGSLPDAGHVIRFSRFIAAAHFGLIRLGTAHGSGRISNWPCEHAPISRGPVCRRHG